MDNGQHLTGIAFDQNGYKWIQSFRNGVIVFDDGGTLANTNDDKVAFLIGEINKELVSLERQMDKIVEKSKIPVEEGESDLLKMMDTTRAIPNVPIDKNLPRVE